MEKEKKEYPKTYEECNRIMGATEQKSIDDKKIKTLYEDIAESKWFTDSYKGKSLGEFIEVEL